MIIAKITENAEEISASNRWGGSHPRRGCDRTEKGAFLYRPYRAWEPRVDVNLGRWPRLSYDGLSALSTPSHSNLIRPFDRGDGLVRIVSKGQ